MPDPNNTPCSVTEALGFLQHNLHKLSERQSTSKNAIHTTLVALSAQLQQLMLQLNTPALEDSPVPPLSPPPMVPQSKVRPKLTSPLDFGGKCTAGRAFLNSCTLSMRLAPKQFDTKLEKVLWALTFFKSGRTSENLFRDKAVMGSFPIQSWTVFEQQFQALFLPINAKADAINTLEGSSYF